MLTDTVVELGSFFQRILPKKKPMPSPEEPFLPTAGLGPPPSINQSRFPPFAHVPDGSTELTFDFHRLTVLLLRSSVKDDALVGRKVATLTISDAHISASLAGRVKVQGSLGGLHVLDLTPEGHKHQRIVSVGHDPVVEQNQNLYMLVSQGLYQTAKDKNEVQAFSFQFFQRELSEATAYELNMMDLEIRMASLCYSHSVHFLAEVGACMSEFQQSVANLAMSLKLTAAEMAVDLMHRGTEGLAQTMFIPGNDTSLNYGSLGVPEDEQPSLPTRVRFNALLESPILVLPRSARSAQVLVAHLGTIEITNDVMPNADLNSLSEALAGGTHQEHFDITVRDMSLFSLNVDEKWKSSFSHFYPGPSGASSFLRVTAQELYSCATGRPILHDTQLKFSLHRITGRSIVSEADPFLFPLTDFCPKMEVCDVFEVQGSVVSPLTVSLSKAQYQQILDSLDNLNWNKVDANASNPESGPDFPPHAKPRAAPRLKERELVLNLKFQLPSFSMQLLDNSDQAIVSLSFEDLQVAYEQGCAYSSTVQISLKSLVLEDLMMKEDSKYRRLVASNDRKAAKVAERPQLNSCVSTSCPDLRSEGLYASGARSLPARLEHHGSQWKSGNRIKMQKSPKSDTGKCPGTPPSSPSLLQQQLHHSTRSAAQENLVLIKVLLVDPDSPDFPLKYNSTQRFVEVNFNALDVVVNLESWVMVLDFFESDQKKKSSSSAQLQNRKMVAPSPGYQNWSKVSNGRVVNSRWEVEVRSFTCLLNRKEYEVAQATISNLTWEMASMRGNLDVTGKLGSITVEDLTAAGKLYRERFITSGNEALDFQYFSYSSDDPHLARDYDVRLNLNMASVLYVHTQRFYTECFNMLQQFQQLRKLAANIPNVGDKREPWRHGTRILLNVEAGSPVILVPVCSNSEHLLVIDLGKISVSNRFVMSNGSVSHPTGTKAAKTEAGSRIRAGGGPKNVHFASIAGASDPSAVLVDVLLVEMSQMDLCTGQRQKLSQSQVRDS